VNFAYIRRWLRSLRSRRRPPDDRHALGRRGERAAARFLKRRGCRVLARNYRCPAGEIDLICADADMIVFVEVKTRSGTDVQDPQEAIHPSQWRRIESAARYFRSARSAHDRPCRFDVVTVVWPTGEPMTIEHFEDAHQARRA